MDEAAFLIRRFNGAGAVREELEAVWEYWKHTLGVVYIETPEKSVDFLVNGWLQYQVISCRLRGRSGYYQSGGAFGFRDQLQDCLSLVQTNPGMVREQLLLTASRQYIEGDVQHWWHPPYGSGIRTLCSDDFLWLPFVTCLYTDETGDTGVLDEKINYIEGSSVKPGEDSVERNDHERKERRQKREATIRESENAEREKVQRRVNERRHKKGRDQTPFEIRTKKAKREITESKQGQRKSKKAENEVETA